MNVTHGRVRGPHVLRHVTVHRLTYADARGKVVALVEDGHARVGGAGDAPTVDFTLT